MRVPDVYPPTVARLTPDATAYLMSGSAQQLTYAELDERSNALAHLLRARGVGPGAALVLILPNDLAWPVAVAAGMRAGLLVTPVNWHLRFEELAPILREAAPAAVVTTMELTAVVNAALEPGPAGPVILTVDGEASGTSHLWTALDDHPTTPIDNELLGARVLFSGGTTGRPKAYRQPLLGIHPLDAPPRHPGLAGALGITAGIRLLSPAPSYHAAPFTFQLMTLAAGGTVVCLERFDAPSALQAMLTHGVTHSQWVPTMLTRLLAVPEPDRPPLAPTHRVAFTSGAPCPPELKDRINDWWGPILHEYYGASEGYGHTYIDPAQAHRKRGSVGRPFGAARVRVVDELGDDRPTGEIGRVCFQAPGPAPAALKGMGDMGFLDADGYLFLTGRQTFMIISGGVNIYPEEIEAVLAGHPGVADVAVFGVPHPDLGEQVAAVVELASGGPDPADAPGSLTAYCRERLAGFKVPRVYEFVAELPRLPTGKLNKRALRERFGTGSPS